MTLHSEFLVHFCSSSGGFGTKERCHLAYALMESWVARLKIDCRGARLEVNTRVGSLFSSRRLLRDDGGLDHAGGSRSCVKAISGFVLKTVDRNC